MKRFLPCYVIVVSLAILASSLPRAQADVTLPKVIGSHMVLQRDRALPIWGWADPDEEVTVKLDEATAWPCGPWPRTTARRTSSTRGPCTSR
jgi:sialate O-acetylesterase